MHLAEITVAGCRIYGAALPAGEQGFQAGVVVRESSGDPAQITEWLHASPLAAGQVWSTAEAALSFALLVGEVVAVLTHPRKSAPADLYPLQGRLRKRKNVR